MSDREQHELRGPVRKCVIETIYTGVIAADGTQAPESKSLYTMEYSVEGRITAIHISNPDGSEWITRHTYDASGRLHKRTDGNGREPTAEAVYSYDNQGRPLNIVDSGRLDNPVIFRYDGNGRKTKLQISRPEDYRPNVAEGGNPFQVADRPPNLPGGGSATTFYDEHDRATEVQVRDAKGEIVKRAVRIYDALGHVSEEKQILDNPETLIPAEMRAEILKASGASREELHAHLRKLMGGQAGPFSIAWSYDERGRITETLRRIFNQQDTINTTYNNHGDKEVEITRSKQIGGDEQSQPRPGLPSYSEIRYSYEYDDRGNWTKETMSYRSNTEDTFESSPPRLRTLTYY
jgi:YD repeat-containing protein